MKLHLRNNPSRYSGAVRRVGTNRLAGAVGALTAIAFLAGCAGGAGGGSVSQAGAGSGFAYDASQDEVNAVLDELEPVTLTYQSGSPSPNALVAAPALQFKEYVEERSNGKITLDIAWAGTVASYDEVDDALADGRLDIAYTIPTYFVSEYPTYDVMSKLSIYGPATPLAGEAVTMATLVQMAWENDAFQEEFSKKDLHVLTPTINTGTYSTWCSSPLEGRESWDGKTISVPNASANAVVQALGASPVTLEYLEIFEGLERKTVQCTTATPSSASAGGMVEVAPHVSFPTTGGITRTASANVAGTSFAELPLAYQQIIFDADVAVADGFLSAIEDTTVDNFEVSKAAGGSFRPFDDDTQSVVDETQQAIVDEAVESENISPEEVQRAQELAEHWSIKADEVGLVDRGTLEDFSDWYEPSNVDFVPFWESVFDEVYVPHRPGQ